MGTQPPPQKGAEPPPIFGPCLLWPNGCMDQDATWYGGRPQPMRHCLRRSPSSPHLKGHNPQFSANVRCGQTAGWTKMPLSMEVNLGAGDFVFDMDPATPINKGRVTATQFLAHVYCVHCPSGWMDQDATWYGGKHRLRQRCAIWGRSSP